MTRKTSDRICLLKDDLPSGASGNAGHSAASSASNIENPCETPSGQSKKKGVFVSSIVVTAIAAIAFVPFAAFAAAILPPILKGGAENLGQGLGMILLLPLYLMCSAAVVALSTAGGVLAATGLRKADGRMRTWFLCDLIFCALLFVLAAASVVTLFVANAFNNADSAALAAFFHTVL